MNEFLTPRVVKAEFTVLASAATQAVPSGVYLPKGAMVTGVTIFDADALGSVHSNDSASFDLRAGALALISTSCVSDMAAQTIVYRGALVSSGGMYVPADGQLVLSVQESSGTLARTWSPTMYIGYVK
jgi:hypothetical protein